MEPTVGAPHAAHPRICPGLPPLPTCAGGAPYNPQLGYSIAPNNPYISGGKPVAASSTLGLLSALGGLGLSTAALRPPSLNAGH